MSTPQAQSRIDYIDTARGIGIILVLLGHITLPKTALNYIYLFHMPLFIFLSGAFHKDLTIEKEIKRAAWLLSSIIFYGAIFLSISAVYFGRDELKHAKNLISLTPNGIWEIPFFGVFWFLTALATIRITTTVLGKAGWAFAAAAFLYCAISQDKSALINLPLCIGPAALLMIYYKLGSSAPLIKQAYTPTRSAAAFALYILVAGIAIAYSSEQTKKISNYHQMVTLDPISAISIAASGIAATLFLSISLETYQPAKKAFQWIGRNSFHFFAWHMFAYAIGGTIIRRLHIDQEAVPAGQLIAGLIAGYISAIIQERFSHRLPKWGQKLIYLR